ncbi:pentapeptide repeat-containing protein [Rhodococcus sp. A14]|uniref:pentapeptide repeat-containing protein n=1 Tax=Rhodococcus sp. A14 TaxID=1194106 RepID=UPI0014202B39|nr:pentapeptide repeat-containing protein [Rhodococcus sp. A14]
MLGFVALSLAVVIVIPWLLVSPEDLTKEQLLEARNGIRSTLLQAIAGLAVGSGAIVAWRKLQDEREAGVKQRELEREGQITDRLTHAIDQLGSEKLQVRIGGMFALERIARDSARDQDAIVEVLTAFVREQAPLRPELDNRSHEDTDARPPADVQAALTVLARRAPDNDSPNLELHLNDCSLANAVLFDAALEGAWLHRTCLAKAGLARAHLNDARLISSHLEGADLRNAELRKADLTSVHLQGANLTGADLTEAKVPHDALRGAKLNHANLQRIQIGNAHWPSASLVGATLDGAAIFEGDLTAAHLQGASLVGARLQSVNLDGARMDFINELDWQMSGGNGQPRRTSLRGADLRGSTLRRANLCFADLRGVVVDGTDFTEADLGGADLRGVDLSRALGLTAPQIHGGTTWFNAPPIVDEETKLPPFPLDEEDPE